MRGGAPLPIPDTILLFVNERFSINAWELAPYNTACWLRKCVAQLAERQSLAGELTLSCAQPTGDHYG